MLNSSNGEYILFAMFHQRQCVACWPCWRAMIVVARCVMRGPGLGLLRLSGGETVSVCVRPPRGPLQVPASPCGAALTSPVVTWGSAASPSARSRLQPPAATRSDTISHALLAVYRYFRLGVGLMVLLLVAEPWCFFPEQFFFLEMRMSGRKCLFS